jgi:mitotic spindle assembly checkpoint protein MAD1
VTFTGAKDADGKMTMSLVAGSENAPEDLEQWMRTWVGEEACIPGLMATVTLDAYERWKAGEVEGVEDI